MSARPWATVEALGAAPELAAFQDEPPQMKSGVAGKTGYLRLGFERRAARTVLADLDRRAPLIAQRALYCDEAMPDMPHVFVVTTTGSLLQGDRLALDVTLGAGARAHLTTQSATRIHSMDANFAAQTQTIALAEDAYLEFLPEPLIPHRQSRFIGDTRIVVAAGATLLYAEIVQPGRKHHRSDESFGFSVMSLAVKAVRPNGQRLFCEKLVIEPQRYAMRRTGVMDEYDVLGNVILCTPKDKSEAIHRQLGARVNRAQGLAFGACRLPNDAGLIFKVLGRETAPVRQKLRELWALVRREVADAPLPPQPLWR